MDRIQKLLTFLLFIEIIVLLCYCTSKSNNAFNLFTGKMLEVEKRYLDSLDTTTNAYTVKHKGSNFKESLLLAHFKRGRPTLAVYADYVPNEMVINNITVQQKLNKTNFKSKILSSLKLEEKKKTIGNPWYNSSNVSTEKKTKCIISFDSESFHEAKKKFLASKSYYLFHVHLRMNWLKNDSSQNNDDLFHWQYVLKKERFLVQLPVDFDLLTYNLLVHDEEETTLEIKLVYNDSNCNQYDFSDTLQSVRLLLWNNVFNNSTNHYLCNRKFENETARHWMYYITTIWIGYDLTCSQISSEQDLYNFQVEKDHLPLVVPLFCYILSLQFVWIFALLDIQKHPKALETKKRGVLLTAKNKHTQTSDWRSMKETPENVYKKKKTTMDCIEDRGSNNTGHPNTIERTNNQIPDINIVKNTEDKGTQTVISTLNKNIQTLEHDTHKAARSTKDKSTDMATVEDTENCDSDYVIYPQKIEFRYNLISDTYILAAENTEDKAVRTNITKCEDKTTKIDEIRIILCPTLPQADQNHCYTIDDRPFGIKQIVIKLLYDEWFSCKYCRCFNNPVFRLIFLLWVFILLPFGLYRTVGRYYILKETYEDYLTVVRPSEPFLFLMLKDICKEECIVVLDAIYATVFPLFYIIVGCISYQIFLTDDQGICCCSSWNRDHMLINDNNKMISERFAFRYHQFCSGLNELCYVKGCCRNCRMCCKTTIKCAKYIYLCIFFFLCSIFPILPFSCFARKCIDDCSCFEKRLKKNTHIKLRKLCIVLLNLVCLVFPISYVVCLRPIISTFTFLFRSFTYFGFVALPIRVHIFRYTFLVAITVTYFVKYFHEIINMNAEILKYVFICEEKRQNRNVKFIDEKLFIYIYGRALFVRKKIYFLFLKMIFIFMYLFITIETFITNQSSLTGTTFKDMLEFLFFIIGPYAISFFLKANKDDFLTTENKTELEEKFGTFYTVKEIQTEDMHNIHADFENSMENKKSFIQATKMRTEFQSRYARANEKKNKSVELKLWSKRKSVIRQNTPKSSDEEKRPLLQVPRIFPSSQYTE